jgi:hypothetical protein
MKLFLFSREDNLWLIRVLWFVLYILKPGSRGKVFSVRIYGNNLAFHARLFTLMICPFALGNPWPWIKAHLPVWCKRCNYVMFARNARYARMTTGASVPLCERCYHEIYTPFGGE